MNANYFTETLLPMHIKLQGLYKRGCGDWWLKGDEYFDSKYNQGGVIGIGDLTVLNNMSIAKEVYDSYLRTPRTIDDSSEEAQKRSLWGMVDWEQWMVIHTLLNGMIEIVNRRFDVPLRIVATPTEAILKALLVQEGIEIRKTTTQNVSKDETAMIGDEEDDDSQTSFVNWLLDPERFCSLVAEYLEGKDVHP